VALRLSCDELAPWAGITPEQAPELAVDLVTGAGRVDLLTVVRGSIYSVGATRPDGHTPPGFNLDLCRSVREAVHPATDGRVPVVAQGSIVDVGQAAWAIDDGVADAVEMTRAQLADAQLVAKVRSGTPERIRPCVLCNQQCAVRDNRNPIVSCTVDPSTGHELDDPELVALDDPGRTGGVSSGGARGLVVVGGGPAGLELARVVAGGGRSVRLVERGDEPGGLLTTIARLPGRERFADLASWLRDECIRAGVEVATGVAVTPELLEEWIADGLDVVLAVGGSDGSAGVPVDRATRCWTPTEVLQDGGASLPDGDVLVWDPIGGPIGVGVAEVLAAGGRTVHVATQDFIVANELARAGDLAPANARLARAGVILHRRSVLREVTPFGATLEDRFTARRSSIEVAAVVDAGHRLPATVEPLIDGRDLAVVGDAVAPRTVHEAILEGRRAAIGR
jgi:2,4-dienoyl-CoA reductase (NADPH2)